MSPVEALEQHRRDEPDLSSAVIVEVKDGKITGLNITDTRDLTVGDLRKQMQKAGIRVDQIQVDIPLKLPLNKVRIESGKRNTFNGTLEHNTQNHTVRIHVLIDDDGKKVIPPGEFDIDIEDSKDGIEHLLGEDDIYID